MNRQTGGTPGSSDLTDRRGQSETLGFILIFSVVILGAVAVVALGAVALDDTEDGLSNDRAEKTMTQFASEGALVALEGSDTQRISFPRSNSDRYSINETAGWMSITFDPLNASARELKKVTLGKVSYEGNDGTRIAYQGGGVWRTSGNGDGSTMVSPPEFHYRSATLTLPIITISGEDTLDSRAVISRQDTTSVFPDRDKGTNWLNPLQDGQVNVTVQSQFYRAWGSYFEERTDGGVTYNDAKQRVTVELVVPFDEGFDNLMVSTSGAVTANGKDPPPPWVQENYPEVDDQIEDLVTDCTNGSCNTIDPTDAEIDSGGKWWYDGDYSGDGFNVTDDVDGNVTVVINGDFEPGSDLEIYGMNDTQTLKIYVREDFKASGSVKMNDVEGNAGHLATLVHTDGEVDLDGTPRYVGLIYAPGSECDFNGGGNSLNLEGGVICEEVTINGNPNELKYDEDIQNIDLTLNADKIPVITFLHVSEHEMDVASE